MEKYKTVKATSKEEAIKKSGLYVGQFAVCKSIDVTGGHSGEFTVIGKFDLKEGQPNAQDNQSEPKTVEESVRKGFES